MIAAKVLSDEVRQKVEQQKARMASAEEAPSITPRETADLMRQLIDILQPGENVTRALKRLRPVKSKGDPSSKRSSILLLWPAFISPTSVCDFCLSAALRSQT